MRFACESCLTRYTLADEKVRGRILKIRCKNCGHVMVVRDPALAEPQQQAPSFEDEATRTLSATEAMRLAREAGGDGSPAGAEAPAGEEASTRAVPVEEAMRLARGAVPPPDPATVEWFAMRHGQQLGPMSGAVLEAKVMAGELGPRNYVWREGMEDWRRMEAVEELAPMLAAAQAAAEPLLTPGPALEESPAVPAAEEPAPTAGEGAEAKEPTAGPSGLDAAALFELPEEPEPASEAQQAPPAAAPVAGAGSAVRGEARRDGPWALHAAQARNSAPRGAGRVLKLVAAGVILAAIFAAAAWYLLPADAATAAGAPPLQGDAIRVGAVPLPAGAPLDPGAVREALATRLGGYQRCVADHRSSGERQRRITVRAVVAPTGAVSAATADGGGDLGVCLADRTRDIRFPSFEGEPLEVSVPLEIVAR